MDKEPINNILFNYTKINKYLILVLLIVIILIAGYYLSYNFRNKKTISNIENSYNNNISFQTDYCSNQYINHRLVDYHINSSYNSANMDLQRYDYISLDVIKKLLYYGVRYFDISIFAKTQDEDTIPVVSVGVKQGDWKYTANVLLCDEVFKIFKEYAFSEQYIPNYYDPLFILLDIKTDNTLVLDKLHTIIKNNLQHKLLDIKYNYEQINIAQVSVCELMDKVVIMSNGVIGNSKLAESINISTNSPNLVRVSYSELMLQHKFNVNRPEFYIKSNKISFHSGISNDYININDYSINLLKMNIKKTFKISITGAKNNNNNTSLELLDIESITKNKIAFKKNDKIKFIRENEGEYIVISGYIINEELLNIEELNKSQLTIVIPDDNLFSTNYNPKNAWYLGCQFVALNYTTNDDNMKINRKFFNKQSIKLKQSSLLNKVSKISIDECKSDLLLSQKPKYNPIYNINFDLLNSVIGSEVIISTYLNNKLKVIYNDIDKTSRISIDNNNNNSIFQIEKSDYNNDSIKIRIGEYYLAFTSKIVNPTTKYLSFITKPTKKADIADFNKKTAFILLKSINSKDKYTSLGYINNEPNKLDTNSTLNTLYYVKYNYNFNYNKNIYVKNTTDYKFITQLSFIEKERNINTNIYIYRPRPIDTFNPLGDVIFTEEQVNNNLLNSLQTRLLGGATINPIDYELIYSNSDEENQTQYINIWRPVAPDGYIAMGVVTTKGKMVKPKKTEVVCVASEFTKLAEFPTNMEINSVEFSRYRQIWTNKKLGFWRGSEMRYFIANEIFNSKYDDVLNQYIIDKPNEFDNPIYTIKFNDELKDDMLFLDKFNTSVSERNSGTFMCQISYKQDEYERYNIQNSLNKIEDNRNKFINYTKDRYGKQQCISLPYAYWTEYYNNRGANNEIVENNDPENLYLTGYNKCPKSQGKTTLNTTASTCLNLGGQMSSKDEYESKYNKDYKGACILDLCDTNNVNPFFINKRNSCKDDSELGKVDIETSYENCIRLNGVPPEGQFNNNKIVKCEISACKIPNKNTISIKKLNSIECNGNTSDIYINTNKDTCNKIKGELFEDKCKKKICYTKDISSTKLNVGKCRNPDYFGTSWVYDENNIKLKDNRNYCITANLDNNNKTYLENDENNKVMLSQCVPGKLGQQFIYSDNKVKYLDNNGESNYCLTKLINNDLKLLECNNNNENQKWNFKQLPIEYCGNRGDKVWVKVYKPRVRKEIIKNRLNIPFENYFKEKYDYNFLHMWILGRIEKIENNNLVIKLNKNNEVITKQIGSDDVVLDRIISNNLYLQGNNVLIRNGDFNSKEYILKDTEVLWEGFILNPNTEENLIQVVMSINSIEPNNNNNNQGRPNYVQVKGLKKEDIRLIKPISIC